MAEFIVTIEADSAPQIVLDQMLLWRYCYCPEA